MNKPRTAKLISASLISVTLIVLFLLARLLGNDAYNAKLSDFLKTRPKTLQTILFGTHGRFYHSAPDVVRNNPEYKKLWVFGSRLTHFFESSFVDVWSMHTNYTLNQKKLDLTERTKRIAFNRHRKSLAIKPDLTKWNKVSYPEQRGHDWFMKRNFHWLDEGLIVNQFDTLSWQIKIDHAAMSALLTETYNIHKHEEALLKLTSYAPYVSDYLRPYFIDPHQTIKSFKNNWLVYGVNPRDIILQHRIGKRIKSHEAIATIHYHDFVKDFYINHLLRPEYYYETSRHHGTKWVTEGEVTAMQHPSIGNREFAKHRQQYKEVETDENDWRIYY
ncbi:TPA: hypothetical protein ACPJ1B_003731 [Vibrio diabolicus]